MNSVSLAIEGFGAGLSTDNACFINTLLDGFRRGPSGTRSFR
jgi:hypothetical protein